MKPNHLINEKSPYLLQHAYNPVDWHPWGEQAFAKARKENKPILLSIGYSTCHWCHVMERESFSDEKTAALMNKHLVAIKLDREERPDIDKVYMTAVSAMTGQGGWPLNVFLTPDLKPFFGGTYFPPEARWGQPGWPALVERIGGLWTTRRSEIDSDAARMAEALKEYAAAPADHADLDPAWLDRTFEAYKAGFDASRGGFGGAPKFPMPVNHHFLLRYYARTGKKEALDMVLKSLREMASGGIFDQVGGGFHRYSTDALWLLPHFEKMLYDNAQLAANYIEAYQASRDEDLARAARETLGYLLRDMRHPEGGFYSAEDADSLPQELAAKGVKDEGHENKSEGAFYLWTEKELRELLGDDAEIFKHYYGVNPEGNLPNDPHGEFAGRNILHAARPLAATAAKFGLKEGEAWRLIEKAKARLLEARSRRPRPGLDDKILASWNGLAMSAFAKGYQALGDEKYLEAAQDCARFVRVHLYEPKTLRLHHRWRDGQSAVPGIADDYAFLVQGLIDLYEASYDPQWLRWAIRLAEKQNELFLDKEGGYYMTAEGHDKNLLVRVLENADNVEPSASSVAALNLLRLEQYARRKDFREAAEKTLRRFASRLRDRGLSLPQMSSAADFMLSKPKQVVLTGDRKSAAARDFMKELHSRFIPNKITLFIDDATRPVLSQYLPFIEGMAPIGDKLTAYVCLDYACELPTNDIAVFADLLEGRAPKP